MCKKEGILGGRRGEKGKQKVNKRRREIWGKNCVNKYRKTHDGKAEEWSKKNRYSMRRYKIIYH